MTSLVRDEIFPCFPELEPPGAERAGVSARDQATPPNMAAFAARPEAERIEARWHVLVADESPPDELRAPDHVVVDPMPTCADPGRAEPHGLTGIYVRIQACIFLAV